MRPLEISSLDLQSRDDGHSIVRINVTCSSTEDVDDIVAWLELAKGVMVEWAKIRTGKIPPSSEMSKRGHKGGEARAAALSPERRSEIATDAAEARWQKK